MYLSKSSILAAIAVVASVTSAAKSSSSAASAGPTGNAQLPDGWDVSQLVALAYKRAPELAPKDCAVLPGGSVMNTCNNGTEPLLKVSSFSIDPYPMAPGHVTFNMEYLLEQEIPKGTTLHITSFKGTEPMYDGDVDLCEHMVFARMFCPIPPTDGYVHTTQILEVPPDVPSGVYSFIATATNPDGEVFIRIAANIEIDNPRLETGRVHGDDL